MKFIALPHTLDRGEDPGNLQWREAMASLFSFSFLHDQLSNESSKHIYNDFLPVEDLLFYCYIRTIWKYTCIHKHIHGHTNTGMLLFVYDHTHRGSLWFLFSMVSLFLDCAEDSGEERQYCPPGWCSVGKTYQTQSQKFKIKSSLLGLDSLCDLY